jgi:hypothetical protein
MAPIEFGKLIIPETEKGARVIRFASIKPEWGSVRARRRN